VKNSLNKEVAFHRLLTQVKRLYESSGGQGLEPSDWFEFERAVEGFDATTGHALLGKPTDKDRVVKLLTQPASVLANMIDETRSPAYSRAARQLSAYDYVFQVVETDWPKGKIPNVIAETVASFGLRIGMDLRPFRRELDAVTASKGVCDPKQSGTWSFYSHGEHRAGFEPLDEDTFSDSVGFKVENQDEVTMTFSRQCWTVTVMGITVSTPLATDMYDKLSLALYRQWKKDPTSLQKPPMVWIRHSRLPLGGGRGLAGRL
jgi:hypothetical protein